MEHISHDRVPEKIISPRARRDYLLPASILISALIVSGAWIYVTGLENVKDYPGDSPEAGTASQGAISAAALEEEVLPSEGVVLPAVWGDLGARLTDAGVIDSGKMRAVYNQRGLFPAEYEALLSGTRNGNLKITGKNAGYLLNLLWALGLGNTNPILDSGEMKDSRYGGAQNFASTGGWTLAKGDAMNHYSRHAFLGLNAEEQALVDKVSRGIYRPCCGNSTHFPDCNHGMAMLGLLELMASQGASEKEMWNAALAVNSYWFPDTYLTIATYLGNKGINWSNVDPQAILGADYSSASGYANIASQVVKPQGPSGGNGCGV